MRIELRGTIELLPDGRFSCTLTAAASPPEAWSTGGEGRTMGEAVMKAAWVFERLEEANSLALHTDYPALLQRIQSSSDFSPWRPPRWMIQLPRETQP